MNTNKKELLKIENLQTSFFTKKGEIKAVDGVDLTIEYGETVGLVGESGSGKSTISLSIMQVLPQPAGKITGGKVWFKGENLLEKTKEDMRQLRGDRLSMIMQDPMVAMNPLLKVGYQLSETLKYHNTKTVSTSLKDRCIALLKRVKVPAPESRINDYPFQFSGGMSQRALIAMGIANNPELLIADEPTTALDVTIAAQVLGLMKDVQKETKASIILITHDLASIAQICSRVVVMYAGRIVEKAPINTFFKKPAHPYSVGLIRSVPVLGRKTDRLYSITGQPPSLLNPPKGCRFAPRCEKAYEKCFQQYPPETDLGGRHKVACWLFA
ncbi:MAG: ABC transporter ATP-binding protein [Proteobacteria bacterium]|nr:ABC transporter ATP-binding protein [Pseudomonadota bacterium]MBU1388313.1 ABC transporter ATP-binding protein [Pseudomonadota bacterium]MBU1542870.1 ABC transporter ATP-binding protein [Pseudomonadota bacterium]MBU2431413.1 ABC transporter ATP-binding protein [Pseudomonadota bacterium]MBU2483075.1 ABC transporter ATP-binding protein [Pseudomonadota bacterium]